MQLHKISFSETHSFSSFFIDYIGQQAALKKFYGRFPSAENFGAQLKEKENSFSEANRRTLVKVLQKQYENIDRKETVHQNIQLLAHAKTFTVTTGHQLNIFTGPLYFIYKLITVINACRELKKQYPDFHFVPVYWMATEDHDYEEIKYCRLYGKKYVWETRQTGAVGRFHLEGMKELIHNLPGEVSIFKKAYLQQPTLADAVRCYVNDLFGDEGLVVVDADDHHLKTKLKTVVESDVLHQEPAKQVNQTNRDLEGLGYHPQVNPRDINFFYLDKNMRGRLERQGDHFSVVDESLTFTEAEIRKLIETEPEKFSPNVILRPLYQEMILPNLAYVGGPAELVYWLQLKGVFDHAKVPFPILMPRNFAMVVDKPTLRKFQKTGLEWKDLFEEKNYLFNHWVVKNSTRELSLGKDITAVTDLFKTVRERSGKIDQTLEAFVGAAAKRAVTSLETIEKKMLRAEKRLHDDKLRQIESVKDTLFPGGGLQERTDNFLNFYQQDPAFIRKLIDLFDPFDFRFNLLVDHD